MVRQLAQNGLTVVLSARDAKRGEAAQQQLQSEGFGVDFVLLDVRDPSSIATAAQTLTSRYGKLDILINNAGILPEDHRSAGLTVPAEQILEVFETNTLGALRVTQAMLPLLRKGHKARVINISSGMGTLEDMDGGYPAYKISKTALNAVTRILAAELAPERISVNSICPGWVQTDMGGASAALTPTDSVTGLLPLILADENRVTGQFLREGELIPW